MLNVSYLQFSKNLFIYISHFRNLIGDEAVNTATHVFSVMYIHNWPKFNLR